MPTILCLGPRGSGKTLLLNALKNPDSVDFNSHSISTHGTNLFHIKIPFSFTKNGTTNSKKANANNNLVQIRELGGKMAPLWRSYYSVDVDKVVFVVDTSNLCQIAAASEWIIEFSFSKRKKIQRSLFVISGVLFYSILAEPKLKKAKILLLLTKMDLAYRQMRNEALLMLQLDKLTKIIHQKITTIQTSAITKENFDEIYGWLVKK
jgi:ADP-ribosylation factor-like protein 1